jgi:CRISP-associated protein Cas1
MNDRVIDLSEQAAFLSVRNGLLVIRVGPVAQRSQSNAAAVHQNGSAAGSEDGPSATNSAGTGGDEGTGNTATYRCEQPKDSNEHAVPLEEIAVIVASHAQITYTNAVLAGIAAAGGIFIACNEKHMPLGMLLPLESHTTQTERFAKQAQMSEPLRKRLWQQIVQAKLRGQARLLEERTGRDWGLARLASEVRSGDPQNVEARAARIYWQALFGEDEFRRNPEGKGVNPPLNNGYAVLRAVVARALCASGLHPSLGIHHHNRYDAFCLADDLMEPFRPVVDRAVAKLRDARGPNAPLDKDSKSALLGALLGRFEGEGESRTRPTSSCFFESQRRVIPPSRKAVRGKECISASVPGKP